MALANLAPERSRPLRREEYAKLVDLGFFDDEDVELLYGRIVVMSPHGAPHDGTLQKLNYMLIRSLGDRATVRIQSAMALGGSQPEPDVAVVPVADYLDEHPSEAQLVIEVAKSSLKKDRGLKARLYAENGIAEYWIVNLIDNLIEVHTDPVRDSYTRIVPYRKGERIRLTSFPDIELAVADILR